MRLTVAAFIRQSARLRRVLDYLGTRLDEEITLATLAELACLSPSALERLYRRKIGETPLATLRRLRLQRAAAQIAQGATSLIDVGLVAGYGSAAAFTHAFARQFGCAPSQWRQHAPPPAPRMTLRLERLPERAVLQLPYSGAWRERLQGAGLLTGSLAVAGAKRWRNWLLLDRDHPFAAPADTRVALTHFVPAADQPQDVPGLDRATQPGGLYAVCELRGEWPGEPRSMRLDGLHARIRETLHCRPTEGRILLRDIRVSGYTAPQERHIALYLPVDSLR